MKTDIRPRGALRLAPCSYGLSKIPFRGPMRPTDGRYIAFLGGADTFAKYIATPYPALIENAIGEVCVNLGCQGAGPDVFLQDTAVQSLCHDAAVVVIQIMGAANQTNAFYKVHPRRNDRFIAPTDALCALYPEVDFTDIAFTGHLISRLRHVDDVRFEEVRKRLAQTWLCRMKALIALAKGPVMLLWLSARSPDEDAVEDPAFVTRGMVESLRAQVADIVEVEGTNGPDDAMIYPALDAFSAAETLGSLTHAAAARALRVPLMQGLA